MEQVNKIDSLYAAYKLEFENVFTVYEPEIGFANFKFEDENAIYVQEVYVTPEARGQRWAAQLTGKCIKEAKEINPNINMIYTTVGVQGNTVNSSLRAITEYGFKLLKTDNELIYFYKEISS